MSKTPYKYKPLYQIVNQSMFNQQVVTIPPSLVKDFEAGQHIFPNKPRSIKIKWGNVEYDAKLRNQSRKGSRSYYQIRWEKDFAKVINETFVQSYVFWIISKEYSKGHHKNLSEPKESLIFQPINSREILCRVYIKIDNDQNPLLEKLIKENVFGWLFNKKNESIITYSSPWLKLTDFTPELGETAHVIYYLAHTKEKLLYVGKAKNFDGRIRPDLGKEHQGMPAGWDKFRYDIIKPAYAPFLERIEDHTIRVLASILRNNKNYSSLEVDNNYTLVNKRIEKL